METYLEEPSEEEYNLLDGLFEEWCSSARTNLLHHMFEIIESHESEEVRELVLTHLKNTFPSEEQEAIIELWITHPIPRMKSFIAYLVENRNLDKPIKAATYLMLDEIEKLHEIDPDFHHLDLYLRDLDPLLGSLLFQRVANLKNPELGYEMVDTELREDDLSLMDLIRRKDFSTLWENILDYPLPFIAELMNIFHDEEWKPVDPSSRELFEILVEQLGTDGWYEINQIKWITVSKKEEGEYLPLSPVEINRRQFELHIATDIIKRPDRIEQQKFQSRGRFNLTNPELGLHIYMETIRRSDFDGMLHVPIYSDNGVELAEFTIPTSSKNNFGMDEDGLYFTVKNKYGIFTVDIDALAAILLPVSRHSEGVNEIIPILLERANQNQKMPLKGLNLLSTLHRGREFALWDRKDTSNWEGLGTKSKDKEDTCRCVLAIDIGNTTTKISHVVKGDCDHKPKNWEVPTLIYYNTPDDYIIGQQVIDEKKTDTSRTFKDIKINLHRINQSKLRIHNEGITAYDAYRDFLLTLLEEIQEKIDFQLRTLALTYPLHFDASFEEWIRTNLQENGITDLELIDELTAGVIGSYRLQNQRDNILIIDIGSSQMSAAIAELPPPKSRKRLERTRMREDFDGTPEIVARLSIQHGSKEIEGLLLDAIDIDEDKQAKYSDEIRVLKHELTSMDNKSITIDDTEYVYSLDQNTETDIINVREVMNDSEHNMAFKLLIRNILVKGDQRGISKTDIDDVLILGKGSNWPMYLKYINQIFNEKEIIMEDDQKIGAKGAGLVATGQSILYQLEHDYMLKTAKSGIVKYSPILTRGEAFVGRSKSFEIRPHSWMENMVIDCWTRSPRFINDEDKLPAKDNEYLEYNRDDNILFEYDRLFREIVTISENAILEVKVDKYGTLFLKITGDDTDTLIETDTSVL